MVGLTTNLHLHFTKSFHWLSFFNCYSQMERIKSYLTFVLSIGIYTLISAQTFRREGQYGVNYASFVKNPLQRLDVAVLIIIRVYKVQECLHRCVSHLECYSVNFAAASLDGTHKCELLNADKFQNPNDLALNETFDHYNIKAGVRLFVLVIELSCQR